jgi:hypothetical protein
MNQHKTQSKDQICIYLALPYIIDKNNESTCRVQIASQLCNEYYTGIKAKRETKHIVASEYIFDGRRVFKVSDPYLGEYSKIESSNDYDDWESMKDRFISDIVDRMGWNCYNVVVDV